LFSRLIVDSLLTVQVRAAIVKTSKMGEYAVGHDDETGADDV
jgi:hypothetical protein